MSVSTWQVGIAELDCGGAEGPAVATAADLDGCGRGTAKDGGDDEQATPRWSWIGRKLGCWHTLMLLPVSLPWRRTQRSSKARKLSTVLPVAGWIQEVRGPRPRYMGPRPRFGAQSTRKDATTSGPSRSSFWSRLHGGIGARRVAEEGSRNRRADYPEMKRSQGGRTGRCTYVASQVRIKLDGKQQRQEVGRC